MTGTRQPDGAEEAKVGTTPIDNDAFEDDLGGSELSDPESSASDSTSEPLIRIEAPQDEPARPKGILFLQMIVFPLLIVGVCVSIVLLIGYLVGENREPSELLREIESGWGKKRMQAAYEFQMRLSGDESLRQDEELAGRVVALLEDPRIWEEEQVRRYLVLALQSFDSPDIVPAQVRALRSEDENTVLYALFGLMSAPDEPVWQERVRAALPTLASLASSESASIRMTTANVLGRIGGDESVQALLPLLRDSDVFVQINATFALAALGKTDRVCELLLAMVEPGWTEGIPWASQKTVEERAQPIQAAIAYLRQLECADWKPAVERLAKEGRSVRVKTFAREALDR